MKGNLQYCHTLGLLGSPLSQEDPGHLDIPQGAQLLHLLDPALPGHVAKEVPERRNWSRSEGAVDDIPEEGILRHGVGVADDDELPPGPGDSHVEPPLLDQEAELPAPVAADQGQDDGLLLSALEAVHGLDLQPGELLEVQLEQLDLLAVGGDYADLLRPEATVHEAVDEGADHPRLPYICQGAGVPRTHL